jgi:glutathione-regulated potassium-efflux system ancillary protein KefG
MRRVLVLFAHPALEKSRVNRALVARAAGLEGVRVHDLYEEYPDFDVDVAREQALLAEHDVIVVQHPFYWYSTPALVKQWVDLVLEHGWAYGARGKALVGKWWAHAITAGGGAEAYRPGGFNRHTVRGMLAPFEQTAYLCGMRFLPPFVVHATHGLEAPAVEAHAARYRALLERLRDPAYDLGEVAGGETLEPGGPAAAAGA